MLPCKRWVEKWLVENKLEGNDLKVTFPKTVPDVQYFLTEQAKVETMGPEQNRATGAAMSVRRNEDILIKRVRKHNETAAANGLHTIEVPAIPPRQENETHDDHNKRRGKIQVRCVVF